MFNVTVRLDRKIQNQINITPEEGHSKQREEKQVEKNISRIEIIQLKDFKDNSTEKFIKDYQSKKESPVLVINLGIVILFLQFELTGRLSLIVPIILIVFYIIGSVFRADFFIFSHVWSHHSRKVVSHAWNIRLQELLGQTLVLQDLPHLLCGYRRRSAGSLSILSLQQSFADHNAPSEFQKSLPLL